MFARRVEDAELPATFDRRGSSDCERNSTRESNPGSMSISCFYTIRPL
jgi:hypothetical protein